MGAGCLWDQLSDSCVRTVRPYCHPSSRREGAGDWAQSPVANDFSNRVMVNLWDGASTKTQKDGAPEPLGQ